MFGLATLGTVADRREERGSVARGLESLAASPGTILIPCLIVYKFGF
jgi:hypothetical protein